MEKTIIIGDLHLDDKFPGYLDAQISSIIDLVGNEEDICDIIFLGDIFNHRRPSPSVLLGFKYLLETIRYFAVNIYILRGNHDSETKADDGVTALSLFEDSKIHVITKITKTRYYTFIPHYENEKTIRDFLDQGKLDTCIFGHYGYDSCVNSRGCYDFSIPLSRFICDTYLGHIHRFSSVRGGQRRDKKVVTVGTPYHTSFSESRKDNYYGVLDRKTREVEFKQFQGGPTCLTVEYEYLDQYEEIIKDRNNFVLVRVQVDGLAEKDLTTLKSDIMESYPEIKYLDLSYKPTILDEDNLSNFESDEEMFSVTGELLKEYVKQSNTTFEDSELFDALEDIKNETQQSKD